MSKIILAFDTAMGACSAALLKEETQSVLACKHEPMQRGQAERLVPLIDEIMNEANVSYQDIGLIACTRGPGAFTGLRLSLATARTFSLSLDIPAIGVSTLETIAFQSPERSKNVMICLETKRKDYYTQTFGPDRTALEQPYCRNLSQVIEAIQKHQPVMIGDANRRLKADLESSGIKVPEMTDILYPDCRVLANRALAKYQKDGDRLQDMEPLYLRDADVSFPATKK